MNIFYLNKYFKLGFFAVLLLNLIALDVVFVKNNVFLNSANTPSTNKEENSPKQVESQLPSDNTKTISESTCPNSCLAQIYTATTSSVLKQPTPTSIATATSKTQPTATIAPQSSGQVREFYVPLGSGSGISTDWADTPGVQAYVDTGNYGKIKKVTFEVTIHIPTGNETAYIRLFNQTDKHPVWFSDVSIEGGDTKLLTSQAITLDSGNKLYQVQMKTTLGYSAVIDQSRIHITLE